jgi:ankyrin repeat protein
VERYSLLLSVRALAWSGAILFTSVGARYFWTSLWIHLNKKYSILQEDKSTPLHFACAQGGLEMIEIMYELQETNFISAMGKTDILNMTPLHRAALFNHVHVVEYLLDKVLVYCYIISYTIMVRLSKNIFFLSIICKFPPLISMRDNNYYLTSSICMYSKQIHDSINSMQPIQYKTLQYVYTDGP